MSEVNRMINEELGAVIEAARRVSEDVGDQVERVLEAGMQKPLDQKQAAALLKKAVNRLKTSAQRRGDRKAVLALVGDMNEVVEKILSKRQPRSAAPKRGKAQPAITKTVQLVARDGIEPRAVQPSPVFQGETVPMKVGFVKTTDIELWGDNDRLEIHLAQFEKRNGRKPRGPELLDIMLSKMNLPGIPAEEQEDQFRIVELARSIAVNGLRKPPIIDLDGTLLDGNRRLAACHYVLNSDEFKGAARKRAEWIQVWQLTEHATDSARNAVVVSLNFEDDCKQPWPEYVKARRIFNDWQAMLAMEGRVPSPERIKELKRDLAIKYAYGPDVARVNRYLKMVEWSNDFEEYHINQLKRDPFTVKHQANHYFQYFEELSKGHSTPGGVAARLRDDESLKHLVFNLLFEDKFRNWNQIRQLKYVSDVPEARDLLTAAHSTETLEDAQDKVDNALALGQSAQAETRVLGANEKIVRFVKFIEDVPVRTFRDEIRPDVLHSLINALKLVTHNAKLALEMKGEDVP